MGSIGAKGTREREIGKEEGPSVELGTGLRIENEAGIDADGTLTISDGESHPPRRQRVRFHRKSAEQTSHAEPMSHAQEQNCVERNCRAVRSRRGSNCKQEAGKSGCWPLC